MSLRKHRPGLSSEPKGNEKCPYKRQTRRRHGEGHVKTEAEIGVMQPQVKGSGKEIRLCLSEAHTAGGGQTDVPAGKPSTALFNSPVGPEGTTCHDFTGY